MFTHIGMRKLNQTWSFRGSKSRNKVSVGEPAEGSLTRFPNVFSIRKTNPSVNPKKLEPFFLFLYPEKKEKTQTFFNPLNLIYLNTNFLFCFFSSENKKKKKQKKLNNNS